MVRYNPLLHVDAVLDVPASPVRQCFLAMYNRCAALRARAASRYLSLLNPTVRRSYYQQTLDDVIMETRKITIQVSSDAARVYEAASEERRQKLGALLSLKLAEVERDKRTLEDVLVDFSRRARERGLTSEILDSILDDE